MHASLAVNVGHWIRTELVEAHGVRIGELADRFGVSRQALSAVLNGRSALTAGMAIRFEKAFGVKAETLLRMQASYDLAQARQQEENYAIKPLELI